MNAPHPLEERLRTGLRAAAAEVPPAPDTIPASGERVVRLRSLGLVPQAGSRRRRAVVALATAAALAALGGTVVVLAGDGGDADRTADIADSDQPTTTTAAPYTPRVVNGRVPGRALGTESKLHTFAADGTPTGTVDLAPMEYVHSATSDLDGGWVACGSGPYRTFEELNPGVSPEERAELEEQLEAVKDEVRAGQEQEQGSSGTPSTTAIAADPAPGSPDDTVPVLEATGEVTGGWPYMMVWYPAGRDPIVLDDNLGFAGCMSSTVQVVDSPDGPVLLQGGVSFGEDGGDMHPRLDGVVLATGERREYAVPPLDGLPMHWSVTTGKALTYIDGEGLQLFDLATEEQLPTAAIDPGAIGGLALSHDGRTAAVLTREEGAVSVEAVVYDLVSGVELFRKSFAMSPEGDELSYDGTTLAVGNFYDRYGPVTVIDVATGAEHTIDGHGVVL
jgi:hypothetical protein